MHAKRIRRTPALTRRFRVPPGATALCYYGGPRARASYRPLPSLIIPTRPNVFLTVILRPLTRQQSLCLKPKLDKGCEEENKSGWGCGLPSNLIHAWWTKMSSLPRESAIITKNHRSLTSTLTFIGRPVNREMSTWKVSFKTDRLIGADKTCRLFWSKSHLTEHYWITAAEFPLQCNCRYYWFGGVTARTNVNMQLESVI